MKKFLVRLLILIVVVAALLYGGLRYLAGSVKASPHAYAKKEFIREMAQDARISKVLPLALSRRELDGYLKEEALPEDLPYTLVTEAGTPGGGATPAAAGTAEDDPPAVQSAAPADSARTEEELTRAREGYTDENGKIFLQLTEQAEDGITVFRVSGPSYLGNVMLIDDASRISLQTKGAYGGGGGSAIGPIADRHGAVAALNGGGFDDPEGKGDGGTPEGYVISNGAIVYGGGAGAYHMVGFNKENKLVIGVMGPGRQSAPACVTRSACSPGTDRR